MPLNPAAEAFIKSTNKKLGEDLLVSAEKLVVPMRFTSGSLSTDVILGGGWPGNQWSEILGKSSAGKTFLALKTIAANQKLNPDFTALWVCAEHYNTEWAEALGVDNTRVVAVPTNKMETGLQVLLEATGSQQFDAMVLDSYPAMLAAEEEEKAMDEATMAKGAQIMGRFIRKAGELSLRPYDGSGRPFVGLFINQWRDKIGAFARFGTPQTSPGGNGKDYFFYTRVDVSRTAWITEKRPGIKEPVIVGQTQMIKVIKNKSAAPQQRAEVDLFVRRSAERMLDRGEYDTAKEFFAMAKLLRVLGQSGSWYEFGTGRWNGEPATLAAIREDLDLQSALRAEVLKAAADPRRLDMV